MAEIHPTEIKIEISNEWYDYVTVSSKKYLSFAELMGLKDPKIAITDEVDGMVIELHAYVISDHLEPVIFQDFKTVEWEVPATWWDHFKITYSHWWWVKKLSKPKYIKDSQGVRFTIEVTPRNIFPEANVPMPSALGRPFKIYTAERLA